MSSSSWGTEIEAEFHLAVSQHSDFRLTDLSPLPNAPSSRYGHTSTLGPAGRFLYVFGGRSTSTTGFDHPDDLFFATMHVFDLETMSWDPEEFDCAIRGASRHFHTCVCFEEGLYIFGGKSNGYKNDIIRFDLSSRTFQEVVVAASDSENPSPRWGHSGCIRPNYHSMLIFGGYDANGMVHNSVSEFNFDTNEWKRIQLQRPPLRLPARNWIYDKIPDQDCRGSDFPPRRYLHSSLVVRDFPMLNEGILGDETDQRQAEERAAILRENPYPVYGQARVDLKWTREDVAWEKRDQWIVLRGLSKDGSAVNDCWCIDLENFVCRRVLLRVFVEKEVEEEEGGEIDMENLDHRNKKQETSGEECEKGQPSSVKEQQPQQPQQVRMHAHPHPLYEHTQDPLSPIPNNASPPFAMFGAYGQACFLLPQTQDVRCSEGHVSSRIDPEFGSTVATVFCFGGRSELNEFQQTLRIEFRWEHGHPTGHGVGFPSYLASNAMNVDGMKRRDETLTAVLFSDHSFPSNLRSSSYGSVTLKSALRDDGANSMNVLLYGGQTRSRDDDRRVAAVTVSDDPSSFVCRRESGMLLHACPDDALLLVLSFLPPKTLCSLRLVHTLWSVSRLASHDRVWGPVYTRLTQKMYLIARLKRQLGARKSMIGKCQRIYKSRADPLEFVEMSYIGDAELDLSQIEERMSRRTNRIENLKTVVTGEGGVGKTALLITMAHGEFPKDYVPTVFDNYTYSMLFGQLPFQLGLWDTAGEEDYDRLRPLSYPQTDVFLICFDVSCPRSLALVKTKWVPEIVQHCPGVPMILIAMKIDLREDEEVLQRAHERGYRIISEVEGRQFAMNECDGRIDYYVETSSLMGINLKLLSNVICAAGLLGHAPRGRRNREGGRCGIM